MDPRQVFCDSPRNNPPPIAFARISHYGDFVPAPLVTVAIPKVRACLALASLSAVALAGITFTPHYDSPQEPYYFSGTNARASFKAHVSGLTQHISEAQLFVGGIQVAYETYAPQGFPPSPRLDKLSLSVSQLVSFGD